MSTIAAEPTMIPLAELLERLGNVPVERVRFRQPLGSATEEEYIRYAERSGRGCELIDGVIVEKAMGYHESRLAFVLIGYLEAYLLGNDIGFGLAPDGMIRIEGQVREPDVSFFLWDRFPSRILPPGAILEAYPDLSVEILSPSNTRAEMARKRGECFRAGTRLVWEVFPETRAVRVYTDPDTYTELGEDDTLDAGTLLPGFQVPLRRWFDRAG